MTLRAPDGQRRIRMDSIDAPEEGHGADQPGQPDAEASRKHLAELVAGKTLIAQCYEKDQYGREVCALILEDGRSANRLQVEAGYACLYRAPGRLPARPGHARFAAPGQGRRPGSVGAAGRGAALEVALRLLAPAPVRLSPAEH